MVLFFEKGHLEIVYFGNSWGKTLDLLSTYTNFTEIKCR